MLKKIIKMFVVALIIVGVKNSYVGAVEPFHAQTSVGKRCTPPPSELRISQSVVDASSLRLFKVLFNGGSIWKDELLGKFVFYCCDSVIKADRLSNRKIFWNKKGNFNIYSLVDLRDGIFRSNEKICFLFYDKSPYESPLEPSMKYDVVGIRLPDDINVELGNEYFPGEGNFIGKFVEEHLSTKSCICISNDKWMVFFTVDFYKNHPNLEKAEDFERCFNRMLALLCDKKYSLLSMNLFYKHNKVE